MKNQNQPDRHENVSLNQLRQVIHAIMLIKELLEYHRGSKLPAVARTGKDQYPQVFHSFGDIDLHNRN